MKITDCTYRENAPLFYRCVHINIQGGPAKVRPTYDGDGNI